VLLKENRFNSGCFFLLGAAFWGQKVGFKDFAWSRLTGAPVTGIDRSGLSGSGVCRLRQKMNPTIFSEDEPLPGVPASQRIWAGDIRHNRFCLHVHLF
jgi:hypothetical protein